MPECSGTGTVLSLRTRRSGGANEPRLKNVGRRSSWAGLVTLRPLSLIRFRPPTCGRNDDVVWSLHDHINANFISIPSPMQMARIPSSSSVIMTRHMNGPRAAIPLITRRYIVTPLNLGHAPLHHELQLYLASVIIGRDEGSRGYRVKWISQWH